MVGLAYIFILIVFIFSIRNNKKTKKNNDDSDVLSVTRFSLGTVWDTLKNVSRALAGPPSLRISHYNSEGKLVCYKNCFK